MQCSKDWTAYANGGVLGDWLGRKSYVALAAWEPAKVYELEVGDRLQARADPWEGELLNVVP